MKNSGAEEKVESSKLIKESVVRRWRAATLRKGLSKMTDYLVVIKYLFLLF